MNYTSPRLRDRLAAEYVLGTLHGRARKRFERLLRDDSELRALLQTWIERLTPIGFRNPTADVPEHVWTAIERRIEPRQRDEGRRWPLAQWRLSAAFTAGLLVGALVVYGVGTWSDSDDRAEPLRSGAASEAFPQAPVLPAAPAPSYVSILLDSQGTPGIAVIAARSEALLTVHLLRPVAPPAGKSLELWALDAAGTPLRLGQLRTNTKEAHLLLPTRAEDTLRGATELAVSAEAAPGKTPVQPSAPFLLRGPVASLW
jgi:anti-sigma-K factor RskA